MKNLLSFLVGIVLMASFTLGFSYTPSANLQTALDGAALKLQNIIEERGNSYKQRIIALLDNLLEKYDGNDKAQYAFGFLKDSVNSNADISSDGTDSSLLPSDFLGSYTLSDSEYGTQTSVILSSTTRIIETNSLPNHDTGDFPNPGNPNTISEQNITYELPLNPNYVGHAKWAREPGIAINGVKLEPETAERVSCTTGEEYKIEAIQDFADLGLDFNNAHVQPTGAYHYHGISEELVDIAYTGDDLVHVAFALDGFKMYYSKSNAYEPSYTLSDQTRTGTSCTYRNSNVNLNGTSPDGTYVSDWVFKEGTGDLDSCNGTYIGDEYVYFLTDEYPYIPRCLNGEFTESRPSGGTGRVGQPSQGGSRTHPHHHGHSHPPRRY